MGISLIILGNMEKCWIVFLKRAFAHFLQFPNLQSTTLHLMCVVGAWVTEFFFGWKGGSII